MPTQAEKAETFHALHHGEKAFLLPNPWDIGTAQMLTGLGAKALATTSAGHAFTVGEFDSSGLMGRNQAIAHARDIARATALPVTGDFENGYGDSPDDVAETIKMAIEAGLAGCSIEDTKTGDHPTSYDFEAALARVKAGVTAARSVDFPFQFCARADGVMIGAYDLEEAIRRLKAFEAAGADVLYIPLLADIESLEKVCAAVTKPVNALAFGALAAHCVADLSAAGARRVSLGSSLFNVAMDAAYHAASTMLEDGDLSPIGKVTTLGKVKKARRAGLVE